MVASFAPLSRRYAPYKLAALVEVAEEYGFPAGQVLRGTRLSKSQLDEPGTSTTIEQYLRAAENASVLCDSPKFPFEIGRRLHLSAYGLYGFALLCSPTVRDGFSLAVRYHGLATPIFSIRWRETAESFIWFFPNEATTGLNPLLRRFLLAQQLSQHVTHVRDLTRASRHPRLIAIAHENPGGATRLYADLLSCPIEFGAKATEIFYDPSVLDERPPLTNRVTLATLRESCERLVGGAQLGHGVTQAVRSVLMERAGEFPSMVDVARELGMTPRTLRRRLLDENNSFSEVLDQLRCELAIKYLTSSHFSTDDIAMLLGFSDASNFRKSFKRWTGKGLSEYRTTPTIAD
jgi:AraC-like DNA-binding protein